MRSRAEAAVSSALTARAFRQAGVFASRGLAPILATAEKDPRDSPSPPSAGLRCSFEPAARRRLRAAGDLGDLFFGVRQVLPRLRVPPL